MRAAVVAADMSPDACTHATRLDRQMTVTYQVGGGGHLDIDFWVRNSLLPILSSELTSSHLQLKDPLGAILYSQHRNPTGTYTFTASRDGRYNYCFSNEMSTVSPKTVS